MDIKLRARLSAYTKIDSIENLNTSLPDPSLGNCGDVFGVGSNGEYTTYPSIRREDIDTLFASSTDAKPVEKDEIDTLFKQTIEPEDDVEVGSVSFSDIDKLFK